MKKLLIVFLILFLIVGCKQEIEKKIVLKKTNIIEQQQNGYIEKQDEIVKPVEKNIDEVKAQETLPIVGNSRLIVIDAGHHRYGNNEQ